MSGVTQADRLALIREAIDTERAESPGEMRWAVRCGFLLSLLDRALRPSAMTADPSERERALVRASCQVCKGAGRYTAMCPTCAIDGSGASLHDCAPIVRICRRCDVAVVDAYIAHVSLTHPRPASPVADDAMAIAEAVMRAVQSRLAVSISAKETRAAECRAGKETLGYTHSDMRQTRAEALREESEILAALDLPALVRAARAGQ